MGPFHPGVKDVDMCSALHELPQLLLTGSELLS